VIQRTADARWEGDLKAGSGHLKVGSGAFEGPYSFGTRFENAKGTNPEELLAAAHAGCFSMQLSGVLTANGTPPTSVKTTAKVTIQAGQGIISSALETVVVVPGIDQAKLSELAEKAKDICPISKAVAGIKEITVKATLKG
jgi:osmotically inducible protein OsmC